MALPFTSLDGTDNNGVRAEVNVQTGTGLIVKLDEGSGGQSVSVHVKAENLKFPIHGWVRKDDPIFAEIKEAFDAKREINYRIESQRKDKVSRTTPIAELRTSTDVARENTKQIFAGINGSLSNEAVTAPSEDPAPDGRFRATDAKPEAVPAPVVTVASRHAIEETPWKTHNTDGRVNIGSVVVQAAVGAETWSRKYLVSQEIVSVEDFGTDHAEDIIFGLASTVLEIADAVQIAAYGDAPRADRGANSHTRARALIFDTVENFLSVPKKIRADKGWNAWVEKVTQVVTTRLVRAISIAFPVEVVSAPAATAPVSAPQTQAAVVPVAPAEAVIPEGLSIYGPIGNVGDGELATEVTINGFRSFVTDAEVSDIMQVSRLLRYTFGTARASEVSDDALGDFLDFYVASGEENFRAVCEFVFNQVK